MVVWGIASRENTSTVQSFVDGLGVSFPILMDTTGKVNEAYALEMAFATAAFPQDWVIGTDGTIVYGNNVMDLGAIETALDRELAE